MAQLKAKEIIKVLHLLQKAGMSEKEIGELPVYIGNDEEVNGIHTAYYCAYIASDRIEDSEYVDMIDTDCGNVKFDGKAILIS